MPPGAQCAPLKLVIDISALDKTASAVTSITNTAPVAALQTLTLGDNEPLDITFTDSSVSPSAAPSWAGATGYTLVVGLGTLDANALLNYTATTSFTPQTAGWTGRLALNTYSLAQAVIMGVQFGGGLANVATDPRTRNQRPQWVYFWLQVQVIDPNGNGTTYALLRVAMLNRTLPASALSTPDQTAAIYAWMFANMIVNAAGITALVGGSATCLDGYDDTNLPTGCMIALSYGNVAQQWKLVSSTATTDVAATPARVRTKNYATLHRVWYQVG